MISYISSERWLSPVEGARLEIVYTLTRIVGSNPTLSATSNSLNVAVVLGGGFASPYILRRYSRAEFLLEGL